MYMLAISTRKGWMVPSQSVFDSKESAKFAVERLKWSNPKLKVHYVKI